PPSNRARRLDPERAPAPFWPRPEVLPVPDPSPRPTRLRALRDPGAGLRLCSPIRSSGACSPGALTSPPESARTRSRSLHLAGRLRNLNEMADLVQHAANLRRVRDLDGVTDSAQTQRAQSV